MQIVSAGLNPTIRLSESPVTLHLSWSLGQTVEATVLPGQGNLVRLIIGNTELLAEWPGQLPQPQGLVQLQIIGREQGVWQMTVLTISEPPVISLPKLLEQLGLGWSQRNLERLQRYLRGASSEELGRGADEAGMFPLNESAWQKLIGFVPNLVPAFLAQRPLPCGLFIGEQEQAANSETATAVSCWLLAVDLPVLGPISAVGIGVWPKQHLKLLAKQESLPILQKTEHDLRKILVAVGMELQTLTYHVSETPLIWLPTERDLYVAGIDLRL